MPFSETGQISSDTNHGWQQHGSIAVIIDCWEYSQYTPGSHNHEMCRQLTDNILSVIPTLPNLTAVILSTYDAPESHDPLLRCHNAYYRNTHELFYQHQPIPYIKHWYQHDFMREPSDSADRNGPQARTDPRLLDHVWPCQQLAMNNIWQLEYYIRYLVPHAKNVFYFGKNWTNWYGVPGCVLGRPMGADRLSELKQWNHLPDVNIMLYQKGILDKQHPDDVFIWPDFSQFPVIDDDVYLYC
jgi:hypothetical protein